MVNPEPHDVPSPGEHGLQRSIERGLQNLLRLQDPDGAWPGDYGGPMFLLPMYIALCHAAGRTPPRREGMLRYLFAVQRADGSFGLSAQDATAPLDAAHSSMFCTALGYVALRILGADADDPRVARMRSWIRERGGPLGAAPWGKFTLCLLGLYDWRGIAPILPELWLLPRSAPFHPGKLWCHCRQVYLPMAWLYGSRASCAPDPLIEQLRSELYPTAYDRIDWPAQRERIAEEDGYRRPSRLLTVANRTMARFDARHSRRVRARALRAVHAHIVYEDEVTSYVDIGPVNKVLNTFVHLFGQDTERFERAFAACEQYLFDGHDGTKMQSYNSSKLWDTAFALQAIDAAHSIAPATDVGLATERSYGYVRDNQILDDVPEHARFFRHRSRGGWPFSNRAHGWPITDCTAEALHVALQLETRVQSTRISEKLLRDAASLLLSWQNPDGGFATYETKRGGDALELLNPSQVFGDIMVDYSYVECTAAVMRGLRAFSERFGESVAIATAMRRAEAFVRKMQRADGSFEGSWAVCFTYGTWFGVSGLRAAGADPGDPAIVRACEFLASKQRADGGFGEHGDSCRERRWVEAEQGQVVQTAWALSTFVRAERCPREAERAAKFLQQRQREDGSYPREPMVGVFNKTCLIDYDNYRHYFPLWALAEWARCSWRPRATGYDA